MRAPVALLLSLCLSPLVTTAADVASKPGATANPAPAMRPAIQGPGVPEISAEQAAAALFSLAPLMQEFEIAVQPLGSHYQPFTQWASKTRQELRALVDAAKFGKTNGEIFMLSNKAKPQFEKAIKIANTIVPLDADIHFLSNQIANTSACLAKRQAALQQADEKTKAAAQFALSGMPANVAPLKSLLADANAACP